MRRRRIMNSWKGGAKLMDIIDDVRTQLSDNGQFYSDKFLLSAMNSAIKLISLEEDARRLFKYKFQAELASINADGTPAARWELNLPGRYTGKEYINFVKQDDCFGCADPCFKTPKEFFECCRFPENECPGDPCAYTLEHIGDSTTLILDRPPKGLLAVEGMFYISPRRLTLDDITIPLGDSYSEALKELIMVIINKEQTSFDQARMRYEDVDKVITDIVQSLALQHMNDEPLIVKGGLD
jgi:hypothetical protein